MASAPITSWQLEGKKAEAVTDSLFLALNSLRMVTSHEIRRQLLLVGKAMTNPDNVLKSKDITLWTMVRIFKAKSRLRPSQWSHMTVRAGP